MMDCPKYSTSLMNNSYLHGMSSPATMNMPNMTSYVTSFGEVRNRSFHMIDKEF